MKKIFLFLYTLFFLTFSYAQQEKPFRNKFELKLPVNAINFYQQTVEKSPYFVKEKILQIYPGEKLFIEVEVKGKEILSMRVVNENINIEKTIEIEFSQQVKDRVSESMLLKIYNPLDFDLNYKAAMFIVGNDNWLDTNVIPVRSKMYAYETWRDVIITLVLMDWELMY